MEKKAFKRLKDIWYEKLEKSGFTDIENEDGTLKVEIDPRTLASSMKDKNAKEGYIELATQFLRTHQFSTVLEKRIWDLHCTHGIGAIRIARELKITLYRADMTLSKLRKLAKLTENK